MTVTLERISNQLTSARSPLSHKDKEMIAFVLCSYMQAEVKPEEIITIAIHYDIAQVLMTGPRVALVVVDTFKSILRAQRQQQEQQEAEEQLEQRLLTQTTEVEVDRIDKIYRVWRGVKLLSIFYSISRKNWRAEPSNAEPIEGYSSPEEAQNAVHRAASTHISAKAA